MADQKEAPKKAAERRPQAIKRDHQNKRRRLSNRNFKAEVRTAIRRLEESFGKENSDSQKNLSDIYSLMDKGVKTGVFKLNTAKRIKGRLAAKAFAQKS
jgi:small subunit ribosomal protein S20